MAFTVQHLDAWYGRKQALFDINLSIEPQTVTAMIGPSGCGKSTFVRCLNRMHEEVPDARVKGTVLVDGFDIYDRSVKSRHVRQHIGMVFQQPNVIPTRSIFDNVAMGPRINGMAHGSALRELVESSLEQASLLDEVKDKLDAPATYLSGGQQQRLCIARAVANKPQILLMDEPTSALDPISTLQIEELVGQLKESYTILIVTHNMSQAGRVADRTVFFLLGKLIEEGETSELFSHPHQKETEDYISGRFG
jgi:phosphate transport system ATP-binding protein